MEKPNQTLEPSNRNLTTELVVFYLLTFAFSWMIWIPQALTHSGVLSMSAYVQYFDSNPFGAFGPLVAALVMTAIRGGKDGLKTLFRTAVKKTFEARWLLPTLFLLPLMWISALLLAIGIDGFEPEYMWSENPAMLIIVPIWILFWGGPLQEEFGWRGYALPRFQAKFNSTISSVIVGAIWGIWHVPLYWIPSQTIYYNKPMWGLFASTIMLSVLMTWIYNHSKRSMMLMLLFHTAFNSSHALIPVLENETSSFWHMVFLLIATVAVIIKDGMDLGKPAD